MTAPVLPRYGSGSLADVLPSVLAGLGVPGHTARIDLGPVPPKVGVLVIDGLGWRQLRAHRAHAPVLNELADTSPEPITAGFPATTVTSLTSLGTGRPAGEHGLVGYAFAAGPDHPGTSICPLHWSAPAPGGGFATGPDLREVLVPELFQPHATAFEQAAAAGVDVRVGVPGQYRGSGLTRAGLRGGRTEGVFALGGVAATALAALGRPGRVLCYAYHGDLDGLGHRDGPGSPSWCHQLRHADLLAEQLVDGLPAGSMLLITADHGALRVDEADRIDAEADPALTAGVRLLSGEPRVRHVYTEDGATPDVLAAWSGTLGERAWVLGREEAIAAGWFGPSVHESVRLRIGDVVAAMTGSTVVVLPLRERAESSLRGHHGSLTADEQLIPLIRIRHD